MAVGKKETTRGGGQNSANGNGVQRSGGGDTQGAGGSAKNIPSVRSMLFDPRAGLQWPRNLPEKRATKGSWLDMNRGSARISAGKNYTPKDCLS